MDKKFCLFDNWFMQKKDTWSKMGITVTKSHYNECATKTSYHSYTIELSSSDGEGMMRLYESNNIYWIDFEGWNYNKNEIFCLSRSFEDIESISSEAEEFEAYLVFNSAG